MKQMLAMACTAMLLASPAIADEHRSAESLQTEIDALKKDVEAKNARIAELQKELEKAGKDSPTEAKAPVDLAKLKQHSAIKISDEMSIKIDTVRKKKNTNNFDRYSDQYFYVDADKGSSFITFDFTVTSKQKEPLLPALYSGTVEGGVVMDVEPFVLRLHGWSSHACWIGLYHDSKNDFAKRDTVKFVAMQQVPDDGRTRIVFTDKTGMYERQENKLERPPVSYFPTAMGLSGKKLSLEDLASKCVLIKVLK